MNIVERIKRQSHGGRVAIQDGDLAISYDWLFEEVGKIRQCLEAQKFFSGADAPEVPRIGVCFPNGLGYILVALAVVESGACFVPIPDELTEAEREGLIRTTALHAVLSWENEAGAGIRLPLGLGGVEMSECPPVSPLFPEEAFNALEPAFIRFSSGTTGESKGVVLSHGALFERICAANEGLQIQPGERVLWTLPMAHHFAVSIVLYLYVGATTVLENSHQPDAVYRAAKASGANVLYGSPFHFAQLAQCAEAGPLPELRLAVSTASALSDGVAEAFLERFRLPLTQALGIIEVGLPILNKRSASSRPTALGDALADYEVRVLAQDDRDDGVGELLLRGPGMFDAYLVPWQTRAEVTEEGWFATGDLVEALDDGLLMMRGRSKSVINVGGMKVFPEEIESVIQELPSVQRCRVFSAHHPTLGSYPVGEFTVAEGMEAPSMMEIRTYCRGRLAPYKVPMQMAEVESIELTASGKVRRV